MDDLTTLAQETPKVVVFTLLVSRGFGGGGHWPTPRRRDWAEEAQEVDGDTVSSRSY